MPIYAAERQAGRDPLVVLGGAVTFVNPEPLALFADVIAAGEGEELVPTLVQRIREATGRESLLQVARTGPRLLRAVGLDARLRSLTARCAG